MGMLRYVLLSVCLNACVGEWVIGTPTEPPLAPQVIPSSVTSSSMQVTWPRGDDSKVLHPTEWFEVQYKELGGGTSLLNHQNDWNVVFNGDKVGDDPSPRREGQHEVQVISIRADRGEKITSGYFQLSFSYDGKNYKERYTDSAHSTNDTAVITAPIPWDASASQVKEALEALDTINKVSVRRCDESGGLGGSGGWLGGCPYKKRNGYSWQVVILSSYYLNELNSETNQYQYHGEHKFIDEFPISLTNSKLSSSLLENVSSSGVIEPLTIDNIDLSINLIYFSSSPSFKLLPKMKFIMKHSSLISMSDDDGKEEEGDEEVNDFNLSMIFTILEVKNDFSVIVSMENGQKLTSSLIGREVFIGSHWSNNQYESERVRRTEGSLPKLILYKQTISQRTKWTGGGNIVSVEGNTRSKLHVSACSPISFTAQHDNSPNVQSVQTGGKGGGDCFLKADNLISGRSYAFRVRAHNAMGWSPFSKVSTYTRTNTDDPPSPPQAPIFAGSTLNTITVYINSEAMNEEVSYELQVESSEVPGVWLSAITTSTSSSQLVINKQQSSHTMTAMDLPNMPNVVYRFRSRISTSTSSSSMKKSSAWSSASLSMKLQNMLPPPPPPPVISEPGINSLKLTWLSSNNNEIMITDNTILEHEIQMKKIPNGFFEPLPSSSSSLQRSIKNNVNEMSSKSQILQVSIQSDVNAVINHGEYWISITTATKLSSDALDNNTVANMNGYASSSFSDDYGPSHRSVTRVPLSYDATAEQVREAIQGLVGISANSVHVVRMSASSSNTMSASNQMSTNGAYSWRITIQPPNIYNHPNNELMSWQPPKLSISKNTIAECVRTIEHERGSVLRTLHDGRKCYPVYTGSGPVVKIETIQTGKAATLNNATSSSPSSEEDEEEDMKDIKQEMIINDLEPYTLYSFRIRARNNVGYSDWSEVSKPYRTLHHLGIEGYLPLLESSTTSSFQHDSVLLHNLNKELVWMESGQINGKAGNMIDPDYAHGVGLGGNMDSGDGGDGLAVLSTYVSGQSEPSRTFYFNTGYNEVFVVPFSTISGHKITSLVARLWGAGGGSGRSSSNNHTYSASGGGGGGAFVEVKLAVKEGDHIKVKVGSGGKGVGNKNNGGMSTFGGGGEGGYGDEGGGGSGGGATSLHMIQSFNIEQNNEPLLIAIAAGGGGGGSSNVCCSSGGAGRGSLTTDVPTDVLSNGDSPLQNDDASQASAMGGYGGMMDGGGAAGSTGTLGTSVGGNMGSVHQQRGSEVNNLGDTKASHEPSNGQFLAGGLGGDGVKGGGGGGGGYYGGGGGGGGMEGSGGGGGSSWVNLDAVYKTDKEKSGTYFSHSPSKPEKPILLYVNSTYVLIGWEEGENVYGHEVIGYEIESSLGLNNESYTKLQYQNSQSIPRILKINNFNPMTSLRVRVRSISRLSFSLFSEPLTVTTLPSPSNEWSLIKPFKKTSAYNGYGVAAPVIGRPHLSPNTQDPMTNSFEPIGGREDHTRSGDGPTSEEGTSPSPRRGHTLTLLDQKLFLFGGHSTGYICSAAVTDTNRFGDYSAGLAVDQCNYLQGENNELWTFDLKSQQWELLRPSVGRWVEGSDSGSEYSASRSSASLNITKPPAREQHSINAISNQQQNDDEKKTKLLLFGGSKTNSENYSPHQYDQELKEKKIKRTHFNDLWELSIGETFQFTEIPKNTSNESDWSIPQGGYTFIPIEVNTSKHIQIGSHDDVIDVADMCIVDVKVEVDIKHTCTRQLELVLFGPGPRSNDYNHEPSSHAFSVQLFKNHDGTGDGCGRNLKSTIFNDKANQSIIECCSSPFIGNYQPMEKLAVFNGLRPHGEWVLGLYDNDVDDKKGEVLSFKLHFTVQECDSTVHWKEIQTLNLDESSIPVGRSQHASVYLEDSLFIFGGYTSNQHGSTMLLHDIWRFDLQKGNSYHTWTQLSSTSSSSSTSYSNLQYRHSSLGSQYTGRSALLSPYGLILYGGLSMHNNDMNSNNNNHQLVNNDVWKMDVWNENFEKIKIGNENDKEYNNFLRSNNHMNMKISGQNPHFHRQTGRLSGLGERFPKLSEETSSAGQGGGGRYLSAIAWLDDYLLTFDQKKDLNMMEEESSMETYISSQNIPSLFTFGGEDSARVNFDDLRKLNLEGFASTSTSTSSMMNKDIKSTHCDHWLLNNSTSDLLYKNACTSTTSNGGCSLHLVLKRAWCRGEFQSVGFL